MLELLYSCLEKWKPDLLDHWPDGEMGYEWGGELRDAVIFELLEVGFNHHLLNEQGQKLDQLIEAIDIQLASLTAK